MVIKWLEISWGRSLGRLDRLGEEKEGKKKEKKEKGEEIPLEAHSAKLFPNNFSIFLVSVGSSSDTSFVFEFN